ncbi:MAG: UbiD family decarboxylase [Candidatus Bathyarchaeia archaeon]
MSLRSFLEEMEKEREVVHVRDQVSPRFEVSSIMKAFNGGPILLFENVEGHDTRIVANICGTRRRICSALRVSPENLYKKLISAWRSPTSPRIVKEGPVKEVVEKARLSRIPVLTHFEKDAGAYITSAIVSARSPDGKIENVSIHRLLILDDTHLAIRLVPRQLFRLWEMAKEEKRDLEVAIAIGLHPAVLLAASSSVPFGVSEFGIANALLENKMHLIKGECVGAYAPAEAEIVLEGVISTEKETMEGPLVDITGTYDIQRSQPIIELVSIMHRKDYLYQALLPSGAEHKLLMGLPREVMIWDAVAKVVPIVKAVILSSGGGGWLHAIISIEKQTEGDGKNALLAAFGAHGSLKHAVVVDTDIDVFNPEEVEWAIATRFQASKDLVIIPCVRGSTLDPSADQETAITTKLGVDATRPLTKPYEKFEPAKIPTSKEIVDIISKIRERVKHNDSRP